MSHAIARERSATSAGSERAVEDIGSLTRPGNGHPEALPRALPNALDDAQARASALVAGIAADAAADPELYLRATVVPEGGE